MARKPSPAAAPRPLSVRRQGLQKFAIVCFSKEGKLLATIHGGETIELRFAKGRGSPRLFVNGKPFIRSHHLVPPETTRIEIECENGRGGW